MNEGNNMMDTIVTDSTREGVNVTDLKDLREGMQINATVKKIVNFGAFVDVGVGVDGLIHISKMSNKYVNDPSEIVSIGEQVMVKVIGIDLSAKKISLSMKDENEASDSRSAGRNDRSGGSYSRTNTNSSSGRFNSKGY